MRPKHQPEPPAVAIIRDLLAMGYTSRDLCLDAATMRLETDGMPPEQARAAVEAAWVQHFEPKPPI